ncbi:protein translocase subunit SecF [Stomatohabitans albus]|uniref:protein translocase subunit SecF n=2 Tax=Stomatohabitans albus TaxID=3110766 RepID=UPI00300C0F48
MMPKSSQDGFIRRLVTGRTEVPVIAFAKTLIIVSTIFMVLSAGSLAVRGLNLSIEFTGGSSFQVEDAKNDWEPRMIETKLSSLGIPDSIVQEVNEGTGALVSTTALTEIEGVDDVEVAKEIETITGGTVSISTVGPSWGETVTRQALVALVVFILLTVGYLSWRFEFRMAAAAILALFHDILVAVGVYSIFQWSVSPATITAFLTIMGYSLYDTVVVFDRVREVAEEHTDEPDWPAIVNEAINHVLIRSISMSITSLLPVISLIIIGSGLLGATTLLDLAVALAIGMGLGVYSSIGLASPLLVWFKTGRLDHTKKEVLEHADEVANETTT